MENWLAAFEELKLITWDKKLNTIKINKEPSKELLSLAHQPDKAFS